MSIRVLRVTVACLLVAGIAGLVQSVASDEPSALGHNGRRTSTVTTASVATSSTTVPPPPPRVTISRRRTTSLYGLDNVQVLEPYLPAAEVVSFLPDGSDVRTEPGRVAAAASQVHAGAGRAAFTKILGEYSPSLTGCDYGGCQQGRPPGVEAGIVTMRLDGTDERTLTSGGYQFGAAFSPDGKTILAQHNVAPLHQPAIVRLALFDLDGKLLRIFEPRDPDVGYGFGWFSPDGRSIVTLETRSDGREPALVVLPTDGGEPRELVRGAVYAPAWSHDGTMIAVAAVVRDGDKVLGADLRVYPASGGPARQITTLTRPGPGATGHLCGESEHDKRPSVSTPVWSPDDREIAFVSSHQHADDYYRRYDVMVVPAAGGPVRTIYRAGPIACVSDGGGGTHRLVESDAIALLDWR